MRVYTAHLHRWRPPVLVPEAFSWGALVFGPLWLLRHGAWIAAILSAAALALIVLAPLPGLHGVLVFGVFLLLGLVGQDLRRGHLRLRRYGLAHVIAARNADEALFRLVSHRPDLLQAAL